MDFVLKNGVRRLFFSVEGLYLLCGTEIIERSPGEHLVDSGLKSTFITS